MQSPGKYFEFQIPFQSKKDFLCSINGFRIDRDDNQENNKNKLGMERFKLKFY